ncbi:uncharacterized protein LOC119684937 [Teleopsis dalmanni]|uniref:uncharacterized protein LOC119684937 n=1 Tax=Teleopsis dalmanni TaxID=139649 RepID=UPI0018CD2DEE|nr:uncharacterized protein LOC119684937 [Teleopsis dalmanni]
MTSKNHRFTIKLISGQNVVLVESLGMESEIFVPVVLNGRISFRNIVPNRRCCGVEKKLAAKHINSPVKTNKPQSRPWRLYNGVTTILRNSPVQTSTPIQASDPVIDKENVTPIDTPASNNETLPTPEQARDAVAERLTNVLNNATTKSPRAKRKLYREAFTNVRYVRCTPKRVEELQSSFNLPPTPQLSVFANSMDSTNVATMNQINSLKTNTTNSPSPKWRKCITPLKTYQKRPGVQKTTSGASPAAVHFSNKKVIPTYRANPTEGPKTTQGIEIRKRNLIVDKKTTISPKSFKKQQTTTTAATATVRKLRDTKLPRTRKQLVDVMKNNAFDLLTNSNRVNGVAAKLNQQFRKSCVNKASSTYPKYKVLYVAPSVNTKRKTASTPPKTTNVDKTKNPRNLKSTK